MELLGLRYLKTFFLSDKTFKQVIGVEKSTFQYLLSVLSETYFEKHSGRGRKPKLTLSDLLFMTFKYWRQYVTQLELSVEFMVGEATVHDWIVWVEDTVITDVNFSLKGNESLKTSDILRVCLVDVTESPIQRPKDNALQKVCYSRKKKFHTLKTQVVFDVEAREVIGLAFDNG